jgi:endonuclease III related protein
VPRLGESRLALLDSLDRHYGSLPLPGSGRVELYESPGAFEAVIRVALGLVAEPKLASAAFRALLGAGLVDPHELAGANPLEIDDVFQQARVRLASKALKPLQRIARWWAGLDLDPEALERLSTESIRGDWRGLNGVGPATVDALLLFALGRPTIPVDRASYRILVRHGWLDPSSDYDEARSVLESIASDEPERLAQLSVAFEKLGRDYCKTSAPRCEGCPLCRLLPEGGPTEGN